MSYQQAMLVCFNHDHDLSQVDFVSKPNLTLEVAEQKTVMWITFVMVIYILEGTYNKLPF